MISPISPFLAEFHPLSRALPPAPALDVEPEDLGPSEAERLEAARLAGFEEGRRQALASVGETVAALEADHQAHLASARREWVESEATRLAATLAEAMVQLEERLAESFAAVVAPLLPGMAAAKAVRELRRAVATLLADDETRPVLVQGPADLVATLRQAFGDRPGVSFAAGETAEVGIRSGDTRIETRLGPWAAGLAAAWDEAA